MGLFSTASVTAISNFFDKWRSTAIGWNYGGFSAAMLIFPPLIAFLQNMYGYWGTQLLLTGITSNVAVSALLFHPLSRHSRKKMEFNTSSQARPLYINKNNVQVNTVDSQLKAGNI